jgi:hypothetical protein
VAKYLTSMEGGPRFHPRKVKQKQTIPLCIMARCGGTPIIPALRRLRKRQGRDFKVSLSYIARPCLKKKKTYNIFVYHELSIKYHIDVAHHYL